jgi:hypothetical protein
MAHLDRVTTQRLNPSTKPSEDPTMPPLSDPPAEESGGWYPEPSDTREVRKALARADRAVRRADRAARRLNRKKERASGQWSGARQLVDAAGDAATAALTAVSAAADEAQARLAAKARMRELEHAVTTARAGGLVDVTPPTRAEALKLADRVDPGSSQASSVRGVGFIVAGITALAMSLIGGFGWLGLVVPLVILIGSGSLGDQIRTAERTRRASNIQLELARASLGATERGPRGAAVREVAGPVAKRPRLREDGDPRTGPEVLAVLDRLVVNARGWVPETNLATVQRIRDRAALALPATDEPLHLADHDTWLLRQICIDYVPGALDHYIALPADLASEPLLDGRSARQVLDEQLELIESRLDVLATRVYRREAGGLLIHARFVAESLRPDPFQARLAELAANETDPELVAAPEAVPFETSRARPEAETRMRERA